MGKTEDANCRLCDEATETAWHLLTECPALARTRLDLFFDEEGKSPPDFHKLIEFVLNTAVEGLLRYPIEETD